MPGLGSTAHKEMTVRVAEGAGYPELPCYHVEAYSSPLFVECGSGTIAILIRSEDASDKNR